MRLIQGNAKQSKFIKKHGINYDMRHILLISESDVIWKVLFSTNVLNGGSKFCDDEGSSFYMHKNMQNIKNYMNSGKSIVLLTFR